MTCRENEAVSVEPLRVFGVVAKKFVPKCIPHWGTAHRQAGMATIGFINRIYGKHTDAIDAELV